MNTVGLSTETQQSIKTETILIVGAICGIVTTAAITAGFVWLAFDGLTNLPFIRS